MGGSYDPIHLSLKVAFFQIQFDSWKVDIGGIGSEIFFA